MTFPAEGNLVLAVQPSARGFGWALFEGDLVLVIWGTVRVKKPNNAWYMRQFGELIEEYRPTAVVFESFQVRDSHRNERVRLLARSMRGFAKNREIDTLIYSRPEIGRVVANDDTATRHDVAVCVGKRFPVLQSKLPRKRKTWDPEHDQQCLFDAVALGVTHHAFTHRP